MMKSMVKTHGLLQISPPRTARQLWCQLWCRDHGLEVQPQDFGAKMDDFDLETCKRELDRYHKWEM